MTRLKEKNRKRARRAHRVRAKIHGTAKRPRLSVFRSLKHISAQLIDDDKGVTLVMASDAEIKGKAASVEVAETIGKNLAAAALKKNIKTVVFDRGSYAYHGKVKAVAAGARAGGLKF
jgi:large subunit ribosomal protein L18